MLQELMSNAASVQGNEINVSLVMTCMHDFSTKSLSLSSMSPTVNISGEISKYDAVRLINRPAKDPVQPIVIVDEDALFGHTVRHHPDTQQEHEEEHIHYLEDKDKDKGHICT